MKRWGLASLLIVSTFAGSALLFLSCTSVKRQVVAPPRIEGAEFVGNETCAECHGEITEVFPSSPHARLHNPDWEVSGQSGCESCHGAGSKHVEAGKDKSRFILNPGVNPETCLDCHLEVHAEFRLPFHHPVLEGEMNCVQCHDPHGLDIKKPARGLAMARLNESCAQCHREQTRPVVFEHEAMMEGCVVCHNPHGSISDKMLVQRDANLCLRCHSEVQATAGEVVIGKVDHTPFLRMGTCWTAGCHTAVHGSNFHPKMLH